MADNEDDSGATRTITAAESPGTANQPSAALRTQHHDTLPSPSAALIAQSAQKVSTTTAEPSSQTTESSQLVSGAEGGPPGECVLTGSGAHLGQQSILVGTEITDLANTTIIYVQPDGSLVEGSGLTAEEQQALLDQLTKQQIVQVSDTEAAQLLQQGQLVKSVPVQTTALDPSQLQQVINQVTKSQQQVHVQHNLKTTTQNASQQLKSVAQQVAMQTTGSVQVVQKKSEPVRIQIPPKQEVKPTATTQQKSVAVSHPQVKLPANGSVSSTQIIHIQPVVGQQGQQLFLQQNPGDPPIQLLLQSPTPIVGSLLPLVHKLTGQTLSAGSSSSPAQKPATSPIKVTTSSAKPAPPSTVKTLPTVAKTVSIPLIKTPANGMTAASSKSPVQPPAAITVVPIQTATPPAARPITVATPLAAPPPTLKGREKEKEKKMKKREKKAVKVQTRSGRVSRPPKYKAKDYKFIKTEDLADSHQSDSDDYSDMSVEEEEEGQGGRKDGPVSAGSLIYSHKSRSHRCQTCDKAYIGLGGLNRHYKLNPTHGDPEPAPPSDSPLPLRDGNLSDEVTAGAATEEEKEDDKLVTMETNKADEGSAAAVTVRGFHHRGPGRPRGRGRGRGRGWGRGRGRSLGPPSKVAVGFVSRRGRRGRPPKLCVTMPVTEQQAERRRDRLQEVVKQCEDEELMDIVLPRLTKVLSLWELLLAKVECVGTVQTRFPEIYREFESLQAQVRQAAQDYISSPQGGATPLEVRNIEVARSLGILDEVNRMKVVPGASPSSSLTNKNARYMENSKMLPPSKRFKMENSVPVHQNGIEMSITGGTTVSSLKSCSVSVAPLVVPGGSKQHPASADSTSSSSGSTVAKTTIIQVPFPATPVELSPTVEQEQTKVYQDQTMSPSDITAQMTKIEKDSCPEGTADKKTSPTSDQTSGSTQTLEPSLVQTSSQLQQRDSLPTLSSTTEAKELQEGQEIYIQTEGLTVQLAEPGSDGIVIVNGPDGTTMHIQTPEGVPLEAVQALLGIESSDGSKASH